MSAVQNPQVELLLSKSAEDEKTLGFPVPDAIFEFHTQQALEKLLKALIAAYQVEFAFVHDLGVLVQQLETLGEGLPDFSIPLPFFTPFGVLVRYASSPAISGEDRTRYRAIVAQLREFVVRRVDELPLGRGRD